MVWHQDRFGGKKIKVYNLTSKSRMAERIFFFFSTFSPDHCYSVLCLQGIKLASCSLTYQALLCAWCHRFVGRVCALPSFLFGWWGGVLRGVSPLYRPVIPLVGVRERAGRRPALPALIGQVWTRVSGVLPGTAVARPHGPGSLGLRYRPGHLRVLEVGQSKRVAVDAVVPGPAGGGGEALEGVVGVGGAGRPAAAPAVGHRVQRGVVVGQLLCRDGRSEGGGSCRVSPSWRGTAVDERE